MKPNAYHTLLINNRLPHTTQTCTYSERGLCPVYKPALVMEPFYICTSNPIAIRKSRAFYVRLFFPDTAPPSRPNCRPRPPFLAGTAVGWAGVGSLGTIGGGGSARLSLPLTSSDPSPIRSSLTPSGCMSLLSEFCRAALLALSWTLRNFSRSSTQRMPPSSRPFRRFGRS